jgi:hypothetical protein
LTTQTTVSPARHGLTRNQYIAIAAGVVVVLIGVFFALLWATMRPNIQGTVTLTDAAGKTSVLAGAKVGFVQQKYGLVATLVTDSKGHYKGRLSVDTYKLRVSGCPHVAHAYVTVMLGQLTTRNIPCLTKLPAR